MWQLLDDYDYKTLRKIKGKIDNRRKEYNECIAIIQKLKFNEKSSIFAIEREKGLESIIGNLYQSFSGQDVYIEVLKKKQLIFYT